MTANSMGIAEIASHSCKECPVCGGSGKKIYERLNDHLFDALGEWVFVECVDLNCGVVWLNPAPLPSELWKAYANYYTHALRNPTTKCDALRRVYRYVKEGYLSFAYGYPGSSLSRALGCLLYLLPVRRSSVDTDIRRLHHCKGRLLDVGCGTGEWLAAMNDRGWQGEGVDFDAAAVRLARNSGLCVSHGGLHEQGYDDSSFDAITLNHVLEHVPDPLGTLRECHRLLKNRGVLYIATPNIRSWGHCLFKQNWRGLEPPRHLQIFTPSALNRLLVKAGFSCSSLRTHCSEYVFTQSYHLYSREHETSLLASWGVKLALRLLNTLEQSCLFLRGDIGECIDSLSVKIFK